LTMAKYLLPVLTLVLLFHQPTQAQSKQSYPRWSLSLEAGPAFPTGSFAHFTNPVNMSGDVHTGAAVQFSAAWRFSRYISAMIAGSEQQNKGDGTPYFDPGTLINKSPSYPDWKSSRLMAGAVFTLPLQKDERNAVFLRLLGGAQKTRPAGTRYYSLAPGPLGAGPYYRAGPSLPWTFAWQLDGGWQWKFDRHFGLIATAGIGDSRPQKVISYVLGGDQLVTERASFPTTTLRLAIGAVYFFPYSKKISVAP
jgi:hypothetical protein